LSSSGGIWGAHEGAVAPTTIFLLGQNDTFAPTERQPQQ